MRRVTTPWRRLGTILGLGLGLVAWSEAKACTPALHRAPEEIEAADRTDQARWWAQAETVFVATVTDVSGTESSDPLGVRSVRVEFSPSLVLKGQGAPPAPFVVNTMVGCVPDDFSMARAGDVFVFYRNDAATTAAVGASGGYATEGRLRDPATREAWEAARRR